MSTTTVSKLATALKIKPEKLISQLKDAGISVSAESDTITNDQKLTLLNHLRGSHGTKSEIKSPKKLTVNRRSQSELKLSGGFGTSRTVNVEIRKKATYVNKDSLLEEAKAAEESEKSAKEAEEKIAIEEAEKEEVEKSIESTTQIKESDRTSDSQITNEPAKDQQKKKWKKTKHEKPVDPFEMKELHVKGTVKRRKKRQPKRSVNLSSIDQSHTFEKPTQAVVKTIDIPTSISPQEIAQKLAMKVSEVISVMIGQGIMATGNDHIDQDTAILVVEELGHKALPMDERSIEDSVFDQQINEHEAAKRPPVVTIMGHVDHGKTSLLDYIRKTKVTEGEAGGITQHIGAYTIDVNNQQITFLDTPGHAAFSQMRSRGANITDIVILVVASDDGVKPQTEEAIEHARNAGVPIIVAINKIDKPEANTEKVKNELMGLEVIPEDLGGDVLFVNVSAHSGEGIEDLLESILLQAEVLDLNAPFEGRPIGSVIESGVESGKGAVATILISEGKLAKGDLIIVGEEFGRARILLNEIGEQLSEATPSMPVKVYGLSGAPNTGDELRQVDSERQAKEISESRKENRKKNTLNEKQAQKMKSFMESSDTNKKVISIMIKADVRGSAEAIKDSLLKLSNDEVEIDIISNSIGGITESDLNLAEASDSFVIGFNVRADNSARKLLKDSTIEVKYYSIIYETIEDISNMVSGMASPVIKEEICGLAEVRDIFDSPSLGKIAGCLVIDGTVIKSNPIRVLRDNTVIYEGELESLRRFKDDVNEVKSGTECGIGVKNYNDVKAGDQIECYRSVEVKK
ncbi:MAG: translation initiation factor IF-2 [Gammaproteobacteria bacterium]|nr:translation initiation factor IF-2 [Gammaproteobacteria bacterium]OUT97248.1 MAG: translation initiation factor IF-2 [Gammaproteobacteria bacterium TMED36]|tara:strand:- start:1568 stop:3976 length:2409 start_codon:yes stop_codon:yes gene_type:complete